MSRSEPRISLGIFLGKTTAEASLLRMRKDGGHKRIGSSQIAVGADMWSGGNLDAILAQVFADLPGKAKRANVPVRISLPDPLVQETMMDFEDFPQNPAEASKLVAWRMARAIDVQPETLRCSYQVIGEGPEGIQVIGRAVTTDVFDAVQGAVHKQGIRIARLDGWSGYHFNQCDDAEICLWAKEDWWVLECRADDITSFVASGWIAGENPEGRIADRVIRLARTFVLKTTGNPVRMSLDVPDRLGRTVVLKAKGDDLLSVSNTLGDVLDPSVLVALQ